MWSERHGEGCLGPVVLSVFHPGSFAGFLKPALY